MTVLYFLIVYAALSLLLAALGRFLYAKRRVLPIPKTPVFVLLSLTWGLPATLIGTLCALWGLAARRKRRRFGALTVFYLRKARFGFSLGLFLFLPENDPPLLRHEAGHALQNLYLGPFMPAVVMLPSFFRFQARALLALRGRSPRAAYDDVWFEGQATAWGREMDRGKRTFL